MWNIPVPWEKKKKDSRGVQRGRLWLHSLPKLGQHRPIGERGLVALRVGEKGGGG